LFFFLRTTETSHYLSPSFLPILLTTSLSPSSSLPLSLPALLLINTSLHGEEGEVERRRMERKEGKVVRKWMERNKGCEVVRRRIEKEGERQ
jgi:hypothetical protein